MDINYEVIGNGENIIYLHGWGMDLNSFKNVINKNRRNYLIDLPGFGKSNLDIPYTLDDYVYVLKSFINEHNIKDFTLVGHSFGGRIVLRYARYYDVKKLILVDSAGIRLFSLKRSIKQLFYKISKKLNLRLNMGSNDYKNANEALKGVIRNVCNTDQREDLPYVKCPTLIIYGNKDKVTPVKMGKIINKGIKDSGLVLIPNAGHFSHIERSRYYYSVQEAFLSDKK